MACDGAYPHRREGGGAEAHGGPHPLPHRGAAAAVRFLDLRRSLPLEEMAMRDNEPVERTHDSVTGNNRLMRQHDDRDGDLLRGERCVTPERRVIRAPRLAVRR